MATDKEFITYLLDQFGNAHTPVTAKSMFGEFGLFSEGKCFALVCDNKLYVKPTNGGKDFIGDTVESPPYPGAKPSYLIEDKLEDREWLCELVKVTVEQLPEPRKRKKKEKKEKKK